MDVEKYMLPCLSKWLFGIDCPGCGLQRSILLLAKGQVSDAFQMYPAVFTTIIFFMSVVLHFIDQKRNYQQLMIISAIVNVIFMLFAYFYKIFSPIF